MDRGYGVTLRANVDQYMTSMARAGAATEAFSKKSVAGMQKLGGDMQRVGGQLTRAISLPVLAAGTAAVKMSVDFSTAFGKMQGLAGVTADEISGLKDAVLDLSGETGRAPQELAEALYFLRSSGLDSSEAMDALDMSARASAAGLGSTAVIADAVSSAMNAYAKSGLSAAEATDILVATARAGKAEPEQLAGALGRVLPIASELGVTFADVGGAIAALSLTGNDASTSATLLTNVLAKMLKPSQQGAEALAGVGLSTDTIRASIAENGLLQTLEDLRAQLGDAGFNKFMEDAQAVQGALSLTGQNAKQVGITFDVVGDSIGSTNEAFDVMSQTAGFKMKAAWGEIQVALIQAGDIIVPIVLGVADSISDLAEKFASLPRPVQEIIILFAGVAAVAGPLMVVAGGILKNFTLLRTATQNLAASQGILAGAASGAAVAMGVLAAGFVAVQAIDALQGRTGDTAKELQALVAASKNMGEGAEGTQQLVNAFGDLSQKVMDTKDSIDISKDMLAWQTDAAFNFKQMSDAFDEVLASSPEAAKALVDELMNVSDAAAAGDVGAREWMEGWGLTTDAIGRWNVAAKAALPDQQDLTAFTLEGADAALEVAGALGTETAAVAEAAAAQADLEAVQKANAAAADLLADAIDDARSDFDGLAAAADHLVNAMDALNGGQQGVEETTRQLFDGMDAFKEKVAAAKAEGDKFATSLDMTNQTGRDNRETVQGLTDDYIAHAAALVADGASMEDAGATVEDLTADMINQMVQMGFSREEAQAYVDQLGLTPETISTAVKLANDQVTLDRIAELQENLGEIPAEKSTEIQALIDGGWYAEAERQLTYLARGRPVPIFTVVTGSTTKVSAEGRFVAGGSNLLSTLGEDPGAGGDEAVLPLGKPGRLEQLLADPRIGGPIMRALGGGSARGGGALGGLLSSPSNITVTVTYPPAPVTVSEPAARTNDVAASSSAPSAASNDDDLMANKFAREAISAADYDAYLAARQASAVLYSSEEMALWSKREQLRRDQARTAQDILDAEEEAREAAAEAEKKRIADEEKARDEALAAEDQRMAAMFELGEISAAQYEQYLTGRQASYVRYSREWMAVYNEIQAMHRAEEAAQRKAMEDQAKAAEDALKVSEASIAAAYKQAGIRKELLDATSANNEADAEYNEAAIAAWVAGSDRSVSAEDKASANVKFAGAAESLADAAYRLRDAEANAAGFDNGTKDWALSVRAALTGDRDWNAEYGRQAIADAIDRRLQGVPAFAAGGHVAASVGGTVVRVAEAGQGEHIVPDDQMQWLLGAMAQSPVSPQPVSNTNITSTTVVNVDGALDPTAVAWQIDSILQEHNRRNGRR